MILRLLALLAPIPASSASAIDKYCSALHWACSSGDVTNNFVARIANQSMALIQSILGAVAVVAIIYAGVLIATSGANEEGRNKGKNIIITTVTGVILAIIATEVIGFAFVSFGNAVS
jgi:hypothetical protein